MNIGFERIAPTPQYPAGVVAAALNNYAWTSKANVVNQFKDGLKIALRAAQLGRCCFCRRRLSDNIATDLEHFIDKDGFNEYRFEIANLALSCGTCNVKKNGYFVSWSAQMERRSKNFVGPRPRICPVVNIAIHVGAAFPTSPAVFRWVNPHVHNYSEHISLHKSWVFRGVTTVGRRTVRCLRLNNLGEVERRALYETLEMRGGRLSMLVCAMGELEHHRALEVGKAIAKVLRRRRAATVST